MTPPHALAQVQPLQCPPRSRQALVPTDRLTFGAESAPPAASRDAGAAAWIGGQERTLREIIGSDLDHEAWGASADNEGLRAELASKECTLTALAEQLSQSERARAQAANACNF